jgi:hypothetical protein
LLQAEAVQKARDVHARRPGAKPPAA